MLKNAQKRKKKKYESSTHFPLLFTVPALEERADPSPNRRSEIVGAVAVASGRLAAGYTSEAGFQVQSGRTGGGRDWGDWGIAAC